MKISKINTSPAFCKVPVMTCKIKSLADKKNNDATLYRMVPDNIKDVNDVRYSKTAQAIRENFETEYYEGTKHNQYYMLRNDKTGEVISCAEISHHYRDVGSQNPGMSTIISNFAENDKYINSGEPTLAYIVNLADLRMDNTVYFSCIPQLVPDAITRAKFSKTADNGISFMPWRRYNHYLSCAKDRSQINYLK